MTRASRIRIWSWTCDRLGPPPWQSGLKAAPSGSGTGNGCRSLARIGRQAMHLCEGQIVQQPQILLQFTQQGQEGAWRFKRPKRRKILGHVAKTLQFLAQFVAFTR
jgi:hypothetical protein